MAAARRRTLSRRLAAAVALILVAATAGVLLLSAGNAEAQERQRRGWSLRELFQPRKPPRRLERIEDLPGVKLNRKPRKQRKARAAAAPPAEPAAPVVEKAPDAKIVLVVGDFLAGGLAEGLIAAYAENPNIRVIDRSSGSSGFVRDDVVNWPARVEELVTEEKPAAVVALVGANDRQQMRIDGKRETLGTELWLREYQARATVFAGAAVKDGARLVWVGLPPFKSAKASADMLAFNGIYKTAADAAGAEFVDIWEGFVDENGAYVSNGPDIAGQPVRLRASDGINFTRAGKRKLAFYAEKSLERALGVLPPLASQPGVTGPAMTIDPAKIPAIESTPPIALTDPELDGGAELLGATAPARSETRSVGQKLSVEGIAPEARPGRADDFSWPPRQPGFTAEPAAPMAAPAAAPAAPTPGAATSPEKTSAVRP